MAKRMRQRVRQVWLVVCPGSELLDLSGPWAVLGYANEVKGRQAYATRLVAPLSGDVRTRHGLALSGARSLRQMAGNGVPDTLVVAGGAPEIPLPPSEARLVRWLRQHHREIPRVVSICTGAFVLGESGLLDGRRATTHWRYLSGLRQRFPEARVADEDIYLRDYENGPTLIRGVGRWFGHYNDCRPHQALGYSTPGELYRSPESYGAKPAVWVQSLNPDRFRW